MKKIMMVAVLGLAFPVLASAASLVNVCQYLNMQHYPVWNGYNQAVQHMRLEFYVPPSAQKHITPDSDISFFGEMALDLGTTRIYGYVNGVCHPAGVSAATISFDLHEAYKAVHFEGGALTGNMTLTSDEYGTFKLKP